MKSQMLTEVFGVAAIYFWLRLISGPIVEAVSTAVALAVLLLIIVYRIKSTGMRELYGWIALHKAIGGFIGLLAGVYFFMSIAFGFDFLRAILNGVLAFHLFWAFGVMRIKIDGGN